MNSQNTPIHIKLWRKDFWFMAASNMLLTISVYMLLPAFPLWMRENGLSNFIIGNTIGVFGLGLFLFGTFCSYLVQKFRRNNVYILSVFGMILCLLVMYYTQSNAEINHNWHIMLIMRFLLGAFFGLAQMVLASTLIIDTSESFQRTEANYSATWFSRFALSLGPIFSLIVYKYFSIGGVFVGSIFCALVAIMLVKMIHVPFKTDSNNISICSLDRFLLPQGFWLFINLAITTSVIGLLFTVQFSYVFYGMIMAGFSIALISQKFVFENAELKSEVVTGLILIGVALLLMLTRKQVIVSYMAPLFVGFGIGIIGSRFLLFFIKLSKHCQRGTSQSTYILAWETGLAAGLFLGFTFFAKDIHLLLFSCIVLIVFSLLIYNLFVHTWYIKHKNR